MTTKKEIITVTEELNRLVTERLTKEQYDEVKVSYRVGKPDGYLAVTDFNFEPKEEE